MPNLSLYDLAVLDRADEYTGLIEDVTTLAPEFTTFAAVKRPSTFYEIVKRTTLPTAQFRRANEGVTPSKSVYKKEMKEMFNLDVSINVDEAIWKADQARLGAIWQLEAAGAMRAAAILLGQQVYYGTSADQYGFTGLRTQFSATVDAGGRSNSTSAYLVWMDEKEGARFDVGMDGQFAISNPVRQQIADPNNTGKNYFAYVGNLQSWVGFNVGSSLSVYGVTGVTTTVTTPGTNGLTDAKAAQLLSYVPVARRNNLCWFLNRTAEAVLQQNRSAINPGITTYSAAYALQPADAGGRPAFSPTPLTILGYPIVLTDSILNTETNS
jgi:hypothetical protein